MKAFNRALGKFASFGPLIIRVVLGGLFLLHGIDKFNVGLSNVEGFFADNGVPAAGLAAPVTALFEIVLGIALIIGLFTRLSALILTVIPAGAILWVKAPDILGSSELDLAYMAGLLGVALLGPGRLSVDDALNTDETVIDLRSSRVEAKPRSTVSA